MIYFLAGAVALFFATQTGVKPVMKNTDSKRFDELFKKYGLENKVPMAWLKAIAMNESSLGNHSSVAHGLLYPKDIEKSKSEDGKSWGLMQVTLTTARDLDPTATPEKLNDAEYSIKLASKYIAWLGQQFSMFDSRYDEWVIKSYNQGVGNTRKEIKGTGGGYANEYWERFLRNLKKVG